MAMNWEQRKDYMLQEEAAGRANEDHVLWLENWRMLGEPETQAAMTEAKKEVDTGYNKDTNETTLYDPTSGRFNTIDVGDDPLAYNPSGDLTDWGYAFGERVLMDATGEGYDDLTYRDQSGDKQGGRQAGFNPITPVTGGGGGFTTGGGDRDAINRDRETNIGPNGEIITAEQNDPFVDRPPIAPGHPDWEDTIAEYRGTYNPSDPFSGVQAGGVQGVGTVAPQVTASRDNPLQGYESSSNKDYYQQQFQNMRAQQLGQQDASNAAAAYQAPEQAPLGDPWANKNLPEVYVQGAAEGYDPNEIVLNPQYEGMTDREVIAKNMSLPVFSDEDRTWFDDAMGTDPNGDPGFGGDLWTRDRQGSLDRNSSSDLTGENQNRVTTMINQLYRPQGDLPTPGGMNVPVNYASPTNS